MKERRKGMERRREGGKGGREGRREGSYLIHRPNLWRKPPMHAQNLPIYQCGQIEVIEHVDAVFPGVGVAVLAHALLVETVHLWAGKEGGREGGRDG